MTQKPEQPCRWIFVHWKTDMVGGQFREGNIYYQAQGGFASSPSEFNKYLLEQIRQTSSIPEHYKIVITVINDVTELMDAVLVGDEG